MPGILASGASHRPRRPADRPQAAFLAQALHQASAGTEKPGNSVQAPVAAVKNWQLAQLLPGLKLGCFTAVASSA